MIRTFMVPRHLMEVFGNTIRDYNPIHREKDEATKLQLEDTPVFGVALQGIAEAIATSSLNFPHPYTRHSFKFANPAFPNRPLTYSLEDLGTLSANVNAVDASRLLFTSTAYFASNRTSPSFQISNDLRNYYLDVTHIETYFNFLECSGFLPSSQPTTMPFMLPASLIASRLLDFSMQHKGHMRALYRSADLSFHNIPQPGFFAVGVNHISAKEPFHKFQGVCYQDDKPIVTGTFTVISLPNNL